MAFGDPEVFFDIILPLLQLEYVGFVGITTLGGKVDNFVNDFIRRKVFEHLEFRTSCKSCLKLSPPIEMNCPHFIAPSWHDPVARAWADSVYGEARRDQFARETAGYMKPPETQCFETTSVCRWFESRLNIDYQVKYLFCTIDPCGGSKKSEHNLSDFCVMTHVVLGPRTSGFHLVGCEAIEVARVANYKGKLYEHLMKCLEKPMITGAKIVVFTESNLGLEASHIEEFLRAKFGNQVIFPADNEVKSGVWTDKKVKAEMAFSMRESLFAGHMTIDRDLVSTDEDIGALLAKFKGQMLRYERLTIPGKNPFHDTKVTFSGKNRNKTDKDDMAITAQLALYWSQKFNTNPYYERYHS